MPTKKEPGTQVLSKNEELINIWFVQSNLSTSEEIFQKKKNN